MKSLPTILIVLFLAFFLVGCPKPEAPEPESEVKQTEQAEVKTQEQATEPIAEKIPEQEAVEEKKAEIVETPKVKAKAEPSAVETEQPPAQKKLEAPQTVVESQKPAEVKKVEAPKDVPEVTQEQPLRNEVQEARAVLEEAIAKVEAAETAEEMAVAEEIKQMAEEAVAKIEKGEPDAPEKVLAVKKKIAPKEAVTIIAAPVEEVAVPIEELGIVYFDYDKSNIKPEFTSIIQSNFEWLINNPDIRVQLEGHCDERGTNEYNLALGERRARSVLNYLLRLGASPEQFSIVSFGEERPVALGQNETAWQKNRRVEFTRL